MNRKLCLILLALALTVTAFAQSEADFEVGLTEDGAGVVIKKYIGKEADVNIPAQIQGMPVREIGGSAFEGNSIIANVVIPMGVTRIGNSAFAYSSLSSITIPQGVADIGDLVFDNCESLKKVSLPEGITKISRGLFFDCSTLAEITLPASIEIIERKAFYGCSTLTSIALPASIKKIHLGAFYGCLTLTTVTIPESVEKIEFYYYRSWVGRDELGLTQDKSEEMGPFQNCPKLTLASQAALRKAGYKNEYF